MNINKKIELFTELDNASSPVLSFASRSPSLNHLSPTVCTDAALSINCRVDTTGNVGGYFSIEVGNIVYNSLSGSTKFNGNNLYYAIYLSIAAITDPYYICQVNSVGVITSISTTCTPTIAP